MSVCYGELGESKYCRMNISGAEDDDILLYEHQLNALIENSVEEVFDDENIVHHENGARMDNSPENLEPVDHSEHRLLHERGEFVEDDDGKIRLDILCEDITSFGADD